MISLRKKPGLMCSAFFVGMIFIASQQASAKVRCKANDFSDTVTRSEVSGIAGGASDNSFALNSVERGVIVASKVDLDIQFDVDSVASGTVIAESVDWVWEMKATKKDDLRGAIVGDYQFNSVNGPMKICSSSNSCMDVVNVDTNVSYKRNGQGYITRARGYVVLTLDLSSASESGDYQANLTVTLHENNTSNPSLCP